MARGYAHAN